MITGSAAEGISDHYSDLDMTVYYSGELPGEETLAQIREANGAQERAWFMGKPRGRQHRRGVRARRRAGANRALRRSKRGKTTSPSARAMNADTPLHKAMSGTLDCVAVHGDEYIARWKAKIR
jgi:hypothetical protein